MTATSEWAYNNPICSFGIGITITTYFLYMAFERAPVTVYFWFMWFLSVTWVISCFIGVYFGLSPDRTLRRLCGMSDYPAANNHQGFTRNNARGIGPRKNKHPNWISLRGTEFELWLQELYQNRGYRVSHVGRPGDDGADLILKKDGLKIVVQAKGVVDKVNNRAVDQVHAARSILDANEAWVVTNSYFTDPARKHARGCGVKIYDRNSLQRYLKTGRQFQGHREK